MTDSEHTILADFFTAFPYFTEGDRRKITSAWDYLCEHKKGEIRACGEPFVLHPMRVAEILASLSMDADTIVAALLHGSQENTGLSPEDVESKFGKTSAALVEGTSRISGLKLSNQTIHQAEAIRKMFFAMVDDVRIIMIRLADRLDKMRNLKNFPEDQQKTLAQETADIWAPLANRMGISTIKDELEDLSLKFTNREVFDQIKSIVASKKSERAEFLENAAEKIRAAAQKAGIEIDIQSRAKHFWSIYQKMKRRGKSADELYDLLAIRILCKTVSECYSLLGIVHTIWKPLEGRFKDYISMPKPNGYQSLHTTVMCEEGRPLEIQIRTTAMHEIAENGIASHWFYKKGSSNEEFSVEDIPIINQLKELTHSRFTDDDFLAQIKNDLLGDSIYVFTPKGDVVELPAGSTAIDFAYYIHSAIGEKISAAKADGSIIPLSRALKNTQVVEIITHPQAHPTINQYNSARTAKARQKIRAWLQGNDNTYSFEKHDEKREERHDSKRDTKHDAKRESPASYIHTDADTDPADSREREAPKGVSEPVLRIRVDDSTRYLVKFAKCCEPTPPQPIVGYISRGRGIIIHHRDCPNVRRIPEADNRLIHVEWDEPMLKNQPPKNSSKTKPPV